MVALMAVTASAPLHQIAAVKAGGDDLAHGRVGAPVAAGILGLLARLRPA